MAEKCSDIYTYIDMHRQEYLARLLDYVRRPSISAHGIGTTMQSGADATARCNGVISRRGQRQQDSTFAEITIERHHALCRHHEARGGRTEQAADFAKTFRAGNKDLLAGKQVGIGPRFDHAADQLVAGHQRISHVRKRRHPSGPQQPLGAGADAAPVDIDDDVVGRSGESRQADRARSAPAA